MPIPSWGFLAFAATLQLSERHIQTLWQALCACGESDTRTLLYALEQLGKVGTPGQQYQVARQWMLSSGRPTSLVKVLERLVERHLLIRV